MPASGLTRDWAAWADSRCSTRQQVPAGPGAAAAPESRARELKESRENQQGGADVLQCQLSSSHGQTLKGIHRAENLYCPKEKCICSGMQRILSLLSSSVGSPEVSLLSGCAVRMKRLHSPIPCSPPDFGHRKQGGPLHF